MASQLIDLSHVGADRSIELYQDFKFNELGIYANLYGDDANKNFAIFYTDKQVDDLITVLSYYKLVRQHEGRWNND